MNSPFIPLGSGEVLPWETHPSLSVIHQLKLFNFPVPSGIILINPLRNSEGLTIEFLEELKEEIRQREFKTDLLVTAFYYNEQGTIASHSCAVESLEILFRQIGEISSEPHQIDFLILERVPGFVRGRAFSQAGFCDDWLEFQLGKPEDQMPLTEIPIEKLLLGESCLKGDFRGRVQELLRSSRRALGEDNWAIEWNDTGEAVFLNSIEKIKSPQRIQDSFLRLAKWENLQKELTVLEGSLIASSSPKLFQYFHHWAPDLCGGRPFVLWQNNQIEFNASLLSDFLRSFGLPTGPLSGLFENFSLSKFPLNTFRFWRNSPRFFRFFHDLRLGPGLAYRLSEKLAQFKTVPDKSFSELFQEWQNIFITSSHTLYRLSCLQLVSSGFSNHKAQKAETTLKTATSEAFSRLRLAIDMKALGWYSRGLIPSDYAIWSMHKDQVLDLESKLE
ncbi:MAG: hypothetical protein ACKN9V_04510 [Pseudomonadota bacterium]